LGLTLNTIKKIGFKAKGAGMDRKLLGGEAKSYKINLTGILLKLHQGDQELSGR
jgi:hypothetical protein